MKNIFKQTFVAIALVLSFASCDNIDLDGFEPNLTSGWVEFESASDQVLSDVGTITIPMEYNVPVNKVNTQVTYTVEVIAGDGAGVTTGTFTATVAENTVDLSIDYAIDPTIASNYTLLFTIVSTSNPDVIIGLEGDNPDTFTLEVCYNVFPLNWTGDAYIGDPTNPSNLITTFDLVLTPTGNDGEYTMNTAWGTDFVAQATGNPGFDGLFIYDGGLFTISPDNTVVISEDPNDDRFTGTVSQDAALNEANGNLFDPCSEQLFYTLGQGLFTNPFTVNVVMSPTAE